MKCVACGKEVSGSNCTHCNFPVYEIVGDNVDESVAQIDEFAKLHRENYLNDVQVGVVAHKWQDIGGKIVEEYCAPMYFASGSDLKNGEVWSTESFARIPDIDVLTVKIAVKKGDLVVQADVQIPNLKEPELQKIGVRLEDKLQVRMLLKNDSGHLESQLISIAIGG